MTTFDTIFDAACVYAGLDWCYVTDNADRNLQVDAANEVYPRIWRTMVEPLTPLFDSLERVERQLSLYIVEIGFNGDLTKTELVERLEDIMNRFILWRTYMRNNGIEVVITGQPFPNWEQTPLDEYGYVINLTCRYTICQN